MTRRSEKKRAKIAYHEAGHAVAAFRQNLRFRYVTIRPDHESLGHVMHERWERRFRPDLAEWTPALRDRLEKRIRVAFAGDIAQRHFAPRSRRGDDDDLYMAAKLLLYLTRHPQMQHHWSSLLDIQTKDMLLSRFGWPFVEAVANGLLEHETLTYDDVRELYVKVLSRKASS